jgi:putative tryptophan/tyrosine transport system substrate-binding protein
MRRREFIAALGGVAAWPFAARAQQRERMRQVGVLMSYVESDVNAQRWKEAFVKSLEESGWNKDRNIQLDYRWSGPNLKQLRADAAELVRLSPDVLLAGATPAVLALQQETTSIPIVFAVVADPVGQGVVSSLARPGANTTGFGAFDFSIGGKWVQIIKEIAPSVVRISAIFNPETAPYYGSFLPFIETAARGLDLKLIITSVHDSDHIPETLEQLAEIPNTGVVVIPAALFATARDVVITTSARVRLPTVYPFSYFAGWRSLVLWV